MVEWGGEFSHRELGLHLNKGQRHEQEEGP